MKKYAIILLVALLGPLVAASQTKIMTVEEASGMNRKLYPATLSQLQWAGDGKHFTWVAKNCLVGNNVKTEKADTLLRLETINSLFAAEGDEPLKSFPSIAYTAPDTFYFTVDGRIYRYDAVRNTMGLLNSFNEKAENTDVEKVGWKVAYTKENNLYISVNGKEVAVTQDANQGIVNGKSVHRNEFGIEKGTFWSPTGNHLAFYRMDESMVTEYPLVDISKRIAELVPTRYPMAGMASHHVTIGVYTPSTATTTWLKTEGPVEQYLTNITWSPDEKYIYVSVLNRDQNHMRLNQYEAATGIFIKTLLEETSDKYVEPLTGLHFLPDKSGRFIRESQQDGFNHLYMHNPDGTLASQLTKDAWVVKEFIGFDTECSTVYFMCNYQDPLDNQLYSCDLKTAKLTRLTRLPGTHRTLVSPDSKYILDNCNNPTMPNRVELLTSKGDPLRTILNAPDPLKDYTLGETTVFSLKADDNSDLWCRLIKPAGFDPTKKYPVIIYVYGGPHSQLVTNSWLAGGGLWLNYLAEMGFAVFTMDNRGTSNRGLAFEQAIFRNLGTPEVADQMKGVAYLRSLPWVDTARIGVNGWSYGGFLTLSMMLRHPGTFKVAVAGGPVIDWKYYEVMYGERYMDTPESNPEGYNTACILNYVKDLKGRVMILNGDQDGTVVPQNSLSFLKKCVDEGIQVDYFVYPGHEHNVRGKDRVHLNKKITDYFIEHL
jgi:dipeptidyl-peptidase 4